MAKQTLPTNFKDDILNSSMGGKRRYKQTTNADGTVSLEDASTYDQVGSNFGASQLNAISKAVNQSADSSKIISDPDTAAATTEQGYIADVQLFNHLTESLQEQPTFVYDEDGKITGYKTKVGADTVFPFSSTDKIELFNGEFVNTNIATVNTHNANIVDGKITSSAMNSGIWINSFNLTNKENYIIVCEFTSAPSSSQFGYCISTASLPSVVNNGTGRQRYMSGSEKNFSLHMSDTYGFYAGFVGTLEKFYLLKIK